MSVKKVYMIAKLQIDPDLIPKIHATCAGETDHVTLMAVVGVNCFMQLTGFTGLGFAGWWHRTC